MKGFDSEKPRIYTWNVNGLTNTTGRTNLRRFLTEENPDVLCLNRTQLEAKDLASVQTRDELSSLHYLQYWNCIKAGSTDASDSTGTATAILTKVKPIGVSFGMGSDRDDSDSEGRVITMEFGKFILVSCYSPPAHDPDRLEYKTLKWDRALHDYLQALVSKRHKYVILCGDMSSAHSTMDNPRGMIMAPGEAHPKTAAPPTRAHLLNPEDLSIPKGPAGIRSDRMMGLLNFGFVDSFRRLHPKEVKYTCWNLGANPRIGNKGWRFDYFMVNGGIIDAIEESDMLTAVMGSDHCPIKLVPNLAKIQAPALPPIEVPEEETRKSARVKKRDAKLCMKRLGQARRMQHSWGNARVEELNEQAEEKSPEG